MSLYTDISPQTLMIIGVVVAAIFVVMLIIILRDIHILSKSRKELNSRVRRLLLSNMIERIGIPLDKYLRKTSDLDKERHIWACEHCPEPDDCEHMFEGEEIDPHTFCPNVDELEKIKHSKASLH